MQQLIGVMLVEPTKKSEPPFLRRLFCTLEPSPEACPVYQRGECISCQSLSPLCVYGGYTAEKGFTRRSKQYRTWLQQARDTCAQGPRYPSSPAPRLALVGEYVWLPYPFMDHEDSHLPFLAHSGVFRFGQPFLRREDFTPEVVVRLATFRPQALMGGEITDYQRKSVPQFLHDLAHLLPELYAQAVALAPALAHRQPTLEQYKHTPVAVTAVTPHTPCVLHFLNDRVPCQWDGQTVTILQGETIGLFFSRLGAAGSITVNFVPTERTLVTVQDPTELARLFSAGAFVGRKAAT